MNEHLPWIVASVAVAGFILNLVVQIRGGAWNAADRETKFKESVLNKMDEASEANRDAVDKLRAETTQNLASLNVDLDKARSESSAQHKDTMTKFGDTVSALREKVNSDALNAERTFLRREDFNIWARSQQEVYSVLDRKVDDRFNRVEAILLNRPWPVSHQTPRPAAEG